MLIRLNLWLRFITRVMLRLVNRSVVSSNIHTLFNVRFIRYYGLTHCLSRANVTSLLVHMGAHDLQATKPIKNWKKYVDISLLLLLFAC